jgi:periplasmic protein TonB
MLHLRWQFILRSASVCALALGTAMAPAKAQDARESAAHVDASQPHAQPPYPDTALASGEQGDVLVGVYVSPSGQIKKFRLAQSSGFNDLDDAAVESVLGWRFVPAIRDGNPVSDWTTVKVVFQMPQPAAANGVTPTSN